MVFPLLSMLKLKKAAGMNEYTGLILLIHTKLLDFLSFKTGNMGVRGYKPGVSWCFIKVRWSGTMIISKKQILLPFLIIFLMIAAFSCKKGDVLKLATTTSTDNTGLLDYLKPAFEKDTGITLEWVAVGTGRALALGKNCDVDVLLVHAPGAEKKYVADGYGVNRRQVMYNDFVIIGPEADRAGIRGKSAAAALKIIKEKKQFFASRGDNSGTNKKEMNLWKERIHIRLLLEVAT